MPAATTILLTGKNRSGIKRFGNRYISSAFKISMVEYRAQPSTQKIQQNPGSASGEGSAGLLFKNASFVNIMVSLSHRTHVVVDDVRVLGPGDYETKQVTDCGGTFPESRVIESANLRITSKFD